ncbi:hypothetical protein [uncultured Psychromonas sp.]|uniref:hypothetical protein n=1 Tax=uncultured Psychromonas sp. TaxID=173974 RepID=UPI002610A0F7|nr:hypothetical protein [uncultured Psychromonas sp.]
MTLIDILDSAVKIGLGAVITAIASYVTLNKTQAFESTKRSEEYFYKKQDERKSIYVSFSILSQTLIQKYEFSWCEKSGDDYKEYIAAYNHVQILSSNFVRNHATVVFNAVTVFVGFHQSESDETIELHKNLRNQAIESLAAFQAIAQYVVIQSYGESEHNKVKQSDA